MTLHPSSGPARRTVLRFGGLAVTVAALSAACSSGDQTAPEVDPDTAPDEATDTEARAATGPERDVSLLNTALSLEVLAVDTYQAALDRSLLETSTVRDAAGVFQQHHAVHRDALVTVVDAAGAEPFDTANPVMRAALVDPGLRSVTTEADFIALARDLEQAVAQFCVHAVAGLSTPDLRSTVASVGAVTSRQSTILDLLGDLGNERLATFPIENPLPSDAIVPD